MNSRPKLADADARDRIRNDLVTTFVVEAAAGTGKTTALIGRVIEVIRRGETTLDRVFAVTFTEKAAGEMKLRLRTEIEQARSETADDTERRRFEHALSAIELAHINTIHGACADLLRERPLQAAVDPDFEVLDEDAAAQLLEEAFDSWFQRVLADPPEGVRRALRRRSWDAEDAGPRRQLLRACSTLVDLRDFDAAWPRPEYDRQGSIDALLDQFTELARLADQAKKGNDHLARALGEFRQFVSEVTAREAVSARDYDELEFKLTRFAKPRYGAMGSAAWQNKGFGKEYGPGLPRDEVLARRAAVRCDLDLFLANAEADLAALLQRELREVVTAREATKDKVGKLDFVDLLLKTRDLLRSDQGVRIELQQRFTHLFVDEFQDTDPLQAEILLLLAADAAAETEYDQIRPLAGKLFVVGDPKQSIYRFRRADVVFYERIKRQLLAGGAELLHLTTSFRSVPEIQAAVNVSFARSMTGAEDGSQAEYVPLTPFRGPSTQKPAVIALPVPKPYGARGTLTKTAVEQCLPDAVAAFLSWLLSSSGWTITESDRTVRLAPRHVCLLFRRMQAFGRDMTRDYVRALEARRIAHVLVGGRALHGREEVIALRAALCAIEWPDDELAVYATLHGPLFAIEDAELLCFRHEVGHFHPLRRLSEQQTVEHSTVASALDVLRQLHTRRNRRPIAETIAAFLATTRAHASLAIWPTGEQALANVLSILDDARRFERQSTSFRSFVDWLEKQSEHGEGQEAPTVEEGAEGVRLMTIHKAKGLEFPVVVLCDPTAPFEATYASRYVDPENKLWAFRICGCRPAPLTTNEPTVLAHDTAESVRLGYVAATRARDVLVVPAFGDARPHVAPVGIGWVDLLAPALYPPDSTRRKPRAAPGCPSFGDDSVQQRSGDATPEQAIQPGLHSGYGGGTEVVWWDPNILDLNRESTGGIRQQDLLKETPQSNDNIRAHDEWVEQRALVITKATEPTLAAHPVTQLARQQTSAPSSSPSSAIPVERTTTSRQGRPGGARFGILVHAALAELPLDADRAVIENLVIVQARRVGATHSELVAAAHAVLAALEHPLLRRALAADETRRETPVVHRLDDGTLAEGIIDLAFRENDVWTVVDFKTDAELDAQGPYAEQVRIYVEAVQIATGKETRGILLSV